MRHGNLVAAGRRNHLLDARPDLPAPRKDCSVYIAPYGRPDEWLRVDARPGFADKPHWSANSKALYFYSGADEYRCM